MTNPAEKVPTEVGPARKIARRVFSDTLPWSFLIILATCTIGVFFAGVHWRLELLSHFQFQYLLGSVVLLIWFAILRKRIGAVSATALVVLNAIPIAPLYFDHPAVADLPAVVRNPERKDRLRLVYANVLTSNRNHRAILDLVAAESPDLVLLLEIDQPWLAALEPLTRTHPHRSVETRVDNFGIGLFSRLPLKGARVRHFGRASLPSVEATVQFGDHYIRLYLTHPVPPKTKWSAETRDEQLLWLARTIRRQDGPDEEKLPTATILIGDFNASPWSPIFAELLEQSGLVDSAVGFGVQPTWPGFAPRVMRIPIDHCLHSTDLFTLDRRIGPAIGSDHMPLVVDLGVLLQPQPPK